MQLQDFFDYKNRLMEDVLTNEEIVKLLSDNVDFSQAESLAYTQVFPFEYLPETTQDGQTYICFDVDVYSVENKTYLTPVLYVWVFAHKSKLRLPEGGVRVDAICNKICEAINGSRFYGLGELNIYACKRFAPQTDYNGKVLTFHAKEFNRQYDPKRPTPTNRKN